MANEFKVKNGLYVSGSTTITNNTTITGSLVVNGGITGSHSGDGSGLTNVPVTLPITVGDSTIDVLNEKVFLSSVNGDGIQMLTQGGSLIYDNEGALNLPSIISGGFDSSAWLKATNGLRIQTGNTVWRFYESSPGYYAMEFPDSTYQTTAFTTALLTPLATTGSNTFEGVQTINSDLVVTGSITAQTLVVQTVTSSIVYSSGSNIFGNDLTNTQEFTGSVTITGSLSVLGSEVLTSNQTASMTVLSSSYASTSSYWSGSIDSASYSSNATSASYALTASYWSGSIESSSYALSSSYSITSSYAATSSYANTFSIGDSLMELGSISSTSIGSNNLITRSTGSYTAAFYNYFIQNGTNARSGQVMAVWNTGSVAFTDVSTTDIGNTSAVTASVAIVSGEVQFNLITNTSGWGGKSTVTYM